MASLADRVAAELENIDSVVDRMPSVDALPHLSELELAGVAAMLHSFYNGVENVLKQVVRERGLLLPNGDSWHRDLLQLAGSESIVSERTANSIKEYLAFRHFFSHAYAFNLEPERLEPLVSRILSINEAFRRDVEAAV